MRIAVLYLPEAHLWDFTEVELEPGATVAEALAASGVLARYPEIDLLHGGYAVGIGGRIVGPDHRLQPGDRVEIYRPLAKRRGSKCAV